MKRLLAALLLIAGTAGAQNARTVEGNGNVTRRDVTLSAFTKVEASGMYTLVLRPGNEDRVTVETDENLQELIEVKQEGSQVHISMKDKDKRGLNFRSRVTMNVYVTARHLEQLDVNLMGAVRTEGTLAQKSLRVENKGMGELRLDLKLEHFELVNEGIGRVVLKGSAGDAGIRNKGMGELDAADFKVRSLTLANKGMGKATVNAEEELIYKDNMMGKVRNLGAARSVVKVE